MSQTSSNISSSIFDSKSITSHFRYGGGGGETKEGLEVSGFLKKEINRVLFLKDKRKR